MSSSPKLTVVIVGAGLAGLTAALGLRRQGHNVSIYDKSDFVGEVGSGLGVMPNASRILEGMWNFDISQAHPVILSQMVMRDYVTGEAKQTSHVGDFKGKFGYDYYGLIRLDIHRALLEAATAAEGEGPACKLFLKNRLRSVDAETGTCTFENGVVVTADLVVGADGIQSRTRSSINVHADVTYSNRSCYRMVISLAKLQQLNMAHLLESKALTLWPGPSASYRVIAGASRDGEMLAVYAIFPTDKEPETSRDFWQNPANAQDVIEKFPDIDPKMHDVFSGAEDLHVWRYVVHEPYSHWTSGKVALLGDAAHPMFPDQNQGYSQAVEDAAALCLVFSPEYANVWNGHVDLGLKIYEKVRKDRATTVQNASLAASKDFKARFGFKHADDPPNKLTLEWLCDYEIEKHVAQVMADHERDH